MFGWGKKGRIAKLFDAIVSGTSPAAALAAVPQGEQSAAAAACIGRLLFEDHEAKACALVEAAIERDVDDEEVLLAGEGAYVQAGNLERSVELVQRAFERRSDSERLLVLLAQRLVDDERAEEALELIEVAESESVDVQVQRGRALLSLERHAEAMAVLEHAIAYYQGELKRMSYGAGGAFQQSLDRARELYNLACSDVRGPEAVIAAEVNRGDLARTGHNYRLLAESLMVECSYRPSYTELEHPERTLERIGQKSSRTESVATLALRGSALLRLGRLNAARAAFELACERDGAHFAGYRGLAAVLDEEEFDLRKRAAALEPPKCPDVLTRVIVDWPALTELERSVVAASVYPLRGALTALAQAGATVRLLPIDVRTVDLPLWREREGERLESDPRALDALGGVASSAGLAVARIEQLLDVESPNGLVFAHEFAHLAHFAMDEGRTHVEQLYERSLAVPYIASTYQMSDVHEFFACAYEDFLRQHLRLRVYREADDQGVWRDVVRMFEQVASLG